MADTVGVFPADTMGQGPEPSGFRCDGWASVPGTRLSSFAICPRIPETWLDRCREEPWGEGGGLGKLTSRGRDLPHLGVPVLTVMMVMMVMRAVAAIAILHSCLSS